MYPRGRGRGRGRGNQRGSDSRVPSGNNRILFTDPFASSSNAPAPPRQATQGQSHLGQPLISDRSALAGFSQPAHWAPLPSAVGSGPYGVVAGAQQHAQGGHIATDRQGTPGSGVSPGTNPQDRIISITHEREVLGRTPMSPSFVPEAAINDTSIWLGTVGPALAQATFEVKTVNDSLWLVDFVTLEQRFPEAHRAVTKLNLPCFNWFSGISSNRTNNPFVFLATHLKHLKVLSFTLNTGGLTTSIYPGEKERMEIEAEDVEKSKELRVKSLDQIIMFYALHQLFSAPMLTKVNITSFDDNNVAYHCKHENPVNIVYQLADFLVDGFVQHQRRVVEVSVRITGATPAQ